MTITTERLPLLSGRDRIMITVTVIAAVAAGALHFAGANAVLAFIVAAIEFASAAAVFTCPTVQALTAV